VTIQVDIWLRGTDQATTRTIDGVAREPRHWVDEDVRRVLEGMLQTMYRAKHGAASEVSPVALRGLSWIVNPYEGGGVVIAIEITLGAAVAGPFDIDQRALETMIARVLLPSAQTGAVH
jgi:hypothetical protein